ncbi:MAG: Unknown protein [uncultured Sulfurovum sp.]|uniref:Uncharacterized protein n=1 Tax=uncultured Sulfurovum sp. TaxID=269237 RepID=A0A6S6STQ5_9BACT|nr:MAG: Unknown protein [uncultured Sulfurovum sp.]
MTTQRIQLDISNDVFDKVMFFLENLPKNLVRISSEQTTTEPEESQLKKFHSLINKSNNKTKLTMKIATDTSEMSNDGLF